MSRSAGGPVTRVWLDVSYAQKDEAKAAGARWDPQEKRWYAPHPGMTALTRWLALPELLPGEDRQFGSGLFVDLIPSSCWFTNVRSCITAEDWDRVRRMVYARAGQRCEACGGQRDREAQIWLEAHERWDYDQTSRIQRLRRLVCLCTRCHEATHFGYATVSGNDRRATAHLMRVTGWSERAADRHIDDAFAEWGRRNAHGWTLDLSMLTDAGVTLAKPPSADQRRTLAAENLHTHDHDIDAGGRTAVASLPAVDPLSATPGPDWFADPSGRFEYRWWDGRAWTADVATGGTTALDPPMGPVWS